jgi:hypothetical protein
MPVSPTQTELIQIAVEDTVQILPQLKSPGDAQASQLTYFSTVRGPILPSVGTSARQETLWDLYWNDHNTLYRSAVAGVVKKIGSTPWELQGNPDITDIYQDVLLNADFGDGWESLTSKILIDYHRTDNGAYIELIGPGKPDQPLMSGITGLATLDPMRCIPTEDPVYPVVYQDELGKFHMMHHTRVVRFYDMPDGSTRLHEYGECALSRCAAAVVRDILVNRWIQQNLDENPPPGIVIFKNISENQMDNAIDKMHRDRESDTGGVWGRSIRLTGLHAETMPEVEFISYTNPPEKFSLEEYKNISVKEIAVAMGLDIQEIWELTGGNIGTATQSEILHQKSKGKGIGRILRQLERVLNQALPASLEFTFKWQDADEDQQRADLANTWVTIGSQMQTMGASNETVMRLLANQVEAIRDVIADEEGEIRVPDVETSPEEQEPVTIEDTQTPVPSDDETAVQGDTEKALTQTQAAFRQSIINIANSRVLGKAGVRSSLRASLAAHGREAYLDGLVAGGALREMTKVAERDLNKWRSQQNEFINKFAGVILKGELSETDILNRAGMWVNRTLNPVYYMGLAEANGQQRYMWIYDPIKEHCADCLSLNGQVHRMKDYVKSGKLPQSPNLDCKGFNCGCDLRKTDSRATGRIPRGRGRVSNILGRIASGIRRLFGKELGNAG